MVDCSLAVRGPDSNRSDCMNDREAELEHDEWWHGTIFAIAKNLLASVGEHPEGRSWKVTEPAIDPMFFLSSRTDSGVSGTSSLMR